MPRFLFSVLAHTAARGGAAALVLGLLALVLLAGGNPSPSRQDRATSTTSGPGPTKTRPVPVPALPEAPGEAAAPDPAPAAGTAPSRPAPPAPAPPGPTASPLRAAWATAGARLEPGSGPAGPAGPAPVRIDIPSIGVSAAIDPIGVTGDGSLEVPADFARAGWYTGRPAPGDVGPAVVVGHVDSRRGPAVFYRLRDLGPGTEVIVHRADGSRLSFTVERTARHPKSDFPTEAVYGSTTERALRLVTCGGTFDRRSRHYRDNVIVFARMGGSP